jgi:hypothetical protein
MREKTIDPDYNWPVNIEYQKPELSICCLAMYVNCNLPNEMWSTSQPFAIKLKNS